MMNDLQNKLSRFEAAPPAGVWDKIAEALETDEGLFKRLYNYEALPPTHTWQRIEAVLDDAAAPAKVIPFATRFRRPIRYVAAASIIAVILISTTLLMKRTEAGSVQAGSKTTVPVIPSEIPGSNNTANNQTQTATPPATVLQTESEPTVQSSFSRKIIAFIKPQTVLAAINLTGKFIPGAAYNKEVVDLSSANNYMVVSDGNGTAMRLSKKLFSLVNCRDGDGSCKERIHQLQQKLSTNAMTADFMGVLDMLRQLQ